MLRFVRWEWSDVRGFLAWLEPVVGREALVVHVGLGLIVFAGLLLVHMGQQESAGLTLQELAVEPMLVGFLTFTASVVMTVLVSGAGRLRLESQFRAKLPEATRVQQRCQDYVAATAPGADPSPEQKEGLYFDACNEMHSFTVEMALRFGIRIPFQLDPLKDMATLGELIGIMGAGAFAEARRKYPTTQESDQPRA